MNMTNRSLQLLPDLACGKAMNSKEALANWNGEFMNLSEVKVSVLDRAFLFGDSIYEVIRVYGGCAWRIEEHLERLSKGLEALKISFDVSAVKDRLIATITQSKTEEAIAYIQVTRGVAQRRPYYPPEAKPNCLIYVQAFSDEYSGARETGAFAITYPDIRWAHNQWKTTSLVANCMASDAAQQRMRGGNFGQSRWNDYRGQPLKRFCRKQRQGDLLPAKGFNFARHHKTASLGVVSQD